MSFLETLADKFFHAFYQKDWPGENESTLDKLFIAEVYEAQDCVAQKRMGVGESVVGYKVGCTSAAIRSQFGLKEAICGRLFHPHVQEEGVRLDWTPLLWAACQGHKEVVELLIAKGADVNAKMMDGKTPLDYAVHFIYTKTADLLRKHGGKTGEELKAEGK